MFAGPMELPLHEDITPKSRVVARVHYGDKLFVLQQRRRLYKLRTTKGVEGWTDERNLMSVEQMAALLNLEAQAQRLPTQGVATTFENLNVHTEPQRFSPSFSQIRTGEKFDVIAHQTTARKEPARRVLLKPQPRVDSRGKKRPDKKKLPQLPPPPAPKPPDDWVELSNERQPPAPKEPEPDSDRDAEPVPTDDWTLVRTSHQTAGWVLTSRIYLAIPDEVAQYAEGHRITTYFSLGKIHDADLNADKDIWLWTTVRAGEHPYDFDSFRVFTWNPRKHRYETAYIQRTVEGFLPVLVKKDGGQETFSVCVANEDGPRLRKRFVLVDRQVHAADVQSCADEHTGFVAGAVKSGDTPPPGDEKKSFGEHLKEKADDVKKRLLGH